MSLLTLSPLLNSAFADSGIARERRRFNITANLTYNSNNIDTKASTTTQTAATSSTFSALEVGGDYFFHPRFSATAQMLFTLTSSIDSEIKGFNVGGRYYPFAHGYQTESELIGSKVDTTPGWAPYVYGGFANRDYQFGNSSISFQGAELGGGTDFHIEQHFFLRGGINFQRLQNTTSRSLTGFVANVGIGYAF